jgi:hypothetical protein
MRTLLYREDAVRGPGSVAISLDGPEKGPFYEVADLAAGLGEPLARFLPDQASLVSVMAARVLDDQRDPDVFVLTDQVRLDPSSIRLLGDRVGPDRRLSWEVPEGEVLEEVPAEVREELTKAVTRGREEITRHWAFFHGDRKASICSTSRVSHASPAAAHQSRTGDSRLAIGGTTMGFRNVSTWRACPLEENATATPPARMTTRRAFRQSR